jgi:cell division protein FtsN
VLPEYETVVDEKQFIQDVQKPAKKQEKESTYILQAASYSSFKDADKLKAKLALNGLSSRIEKISVEGKGQFYRVRLGPYSSTKTKKDVVKRLGTLGIKPLHLKVEN